MKKKKIKKVVIKVGSSLIANYKTGLPKLNWINSFTNDLCFLIKKKINIKIELNNINLFEYLFTFDSILSIRSEFFPCSYENWC